MGVAYFNKMASFVRGRILLFFPGSVKRRLSFSNELVCWKCSKILPAQEERPTFTCPCEHHVILPPTTTNYFHILQCDINFDIDPEAIKTRYHWLQRLLHPDKYTLKSQIERKYAEEHSTLINKSYNTLTNHYRRGLYLLKLHDVEISEKDNLIDGGEEFLERIMSINQEIHSNPTEERLQEIMKKNEALLDESVNTVSECFKKNDLEGAKGALSQMKYYINIKEELLSRLD